VWRTVGLHPHNAAEATPDIRDRLRALADGPDVVGIGESGLDYHYDYAPRAVQAASFEAHLDVAAETGLPLVVHTREAEADTLAILRNFAGRARGVLHCFTGSRAMAEAGVDLGYHVSFSGVITFKRSDDLRATAAAMPEDRLLVETDSPYLAPVPFRGKPCQPAYVAHTATALAGARGVDAETIAAVTSANFAALFPKTANA
ncbi:MAG: TatD family hydrolase, partial [Pseudomonadota bacterium]